MGEGETKRRRKIIERKREKRRILERLRKREKVCVESAGDR